MVPTLRLTEERQHPVFLDMDGAVAVTPTTEPTRETSPVQPSLELEVMTLK